MRLEKTGFFKTDPIMGRCWGQTGSPTFLTLVGAKVAACTLLSKHPSEHQVVALAEQGDQRLQEGLALGIVWLNRGRDKDPIWIPNLVENPSEISHRLATGNLDVDRTGLSCRRRLLWSIV